MKHKQVVRLAKIWKKTKETTGIFARFAERFERKEHDLRCCILSLKAFFWSCRRVYIYEDSHGEESEEEESQDPSGIESEEVVSQDTDGEEESQERDGDDEVNYKNADDNI
ncbi:hypothetical protein JTE90_029194 [Oedothorax gibbosus]|uniref:Uncharacterized protein n=1 Tax=Oedothorax gibbosus TaxID=931172 RepID=A0AAV6VFQ8_9ARAC|nr:hypothetical protein JTE90_029194 [Oedothorax gibbosus]